MSDDRIPSVFGIVRYNPVITGVDGRIACGRAHHDLAAIRAKVRRDASGCVDGRDAGIRENIQVANEAVVGGNKDLSCDLQTTNCLRPDDDFTAALFSVGRCRGKWEA